MGVLAWMAGIGAAISIKLSSSIDDVVWLAPFLTSKTAAKVHNSAIYIGVCLTQTMVAMAIAYSGDTVVKKLTQGREGAWSSEKILTVLAGSILAVYSVYLLLKYFGIIPDDEEEGSDAEHSGTDKMYSKVSADDADDVEGANIPLSVKEVSDISLDDSVEAPDKSDASDNEKGAKRTTWSLFVIAFVGSVDDLTLFVPMLVGRGFDMVQLIIGGFIAAFTIVLICIFIGLCKPIADCLNMIPLVAIVITFALMLLVKAFFMV